MKQEITEKDLKTYEKNYLSNEEKNSLVARTVIHNGIYNSAVNEKALKDSQPKFSIDIDAGKITDQQRSGRCWLFAGLNVLRTIAKEKLSIADIEFSQTYLQFYDKLEKANSFLENVIELAKEPLTSQFNAYIFHNVSSDGGYWSYFVNLVRKYGIVPKSEMPTTKASDNTSELDAILSQVLCQDAYILRNKIEEKVTDDTLLKHKAKMLNDVYRILTLSLGVPPKSFSFEYKKTSKDKDEKSSYAQLDEMTPLEFFQKAVGENLDDYLSISNAQLPGFEQYKAYTSHYLTSVVGGEPEIYFEVPLSILKNACIASLKNKELVWFGSDVLAQSMRKEGILSKDIYCTDELFDIKTSLKKGERLSYYINECNHAMTFTGVNLVKGRPNRWKVENSWGADCGTNGFFVMDDDWFDNYVYQVIVKKQYLPKDVVDQYEKAIRSPIEVLPFYNIFLQSD